MSTKVTMVVIVLMLVVMGAMHYGYLSSNVMAIMEAVLIWIAWMSNVIERMLEEGY